MYNSITAITHNNCQQTKTILQKKEPSTSILKKLVGRYQAWKVKYLELVRQHSISRKSKNALAKPLL
jgi:hypothetical protein